MAILDLRYIVRYLFNGYFEDLGILMVMVHNIRLFLSDI